MLGIGRGEFGIGRDMHGTGRDMLGIGRDMLGIGHAETIIPIEAGSTYIYGDNGIG